MTSDAISLGISNPEAFEIDCVGPVAPWLNMDFVDQQLAVRKEPEVALQRLHFLMVSAKKVFCQK